MRCTTGEARFVSVDLFVLRGKIRFPVVRAEGVDLLFRAA